MDDLYFIELFKKFVNHATTKAETHTLLKWIKKDPRSLDAWMDNEWQTAPNQIPQEVKERILDRIYLLMEKTDEQMVPSTRIRLMGWMKYAAIIFFPILLFTLGYVYSERIYLSQQGSQLTAVLTQTGERVKIILPDSTVAWVNSESRLSYANDYNVKNRILHLEGEAYFDVMKKPNSPFIVQTDYFSVEALGTEFGVCAYRSDKQATAILVEGKVQVERDKQKIILLPDEKALFDKEKNKMSKGQCVDSRRFGEWKSGNIYLENETLDEAVRRLKRIYPIKVVFQSTEVKQKYFTGYLPSDNLASVLEALKLASHVQYEQKSDTVFFSAQ